MTRLKCGTYSIVLRQQILLFREYDTDGFKGFCESKFYEILSTINIKYFLGV